MKYSRGYLLFLGIFWVNSVVTTTVVCPDQMPNLTKWSVWSNRPTNAGQNVTVGLNDKILLDVSPPKLYILDVFGLLVFDPNVNISIGAYYIIVENSGQIIAGTNISNCRVKSQINITLYGDPQPGASPFKPNTGTKVFGIFGQVDIHGAYRPVTWTRLSATASVNDYNISLVDAVDWQIGEQIVIASTDYEYYNDQINFPPQHEVRTIKAMSSNNKTVFFTPPLSYMHWGQIWQGNNNDTINMRGEVGLLTRNIKIRGDVSGPSLSAKWGAHLICMAGGQMRLDGIEVTQSGQYGQTARYPIHFHLANNQSSSYVLRNSIHDNFQRSLTVHGTQNVLITDNVAYNTSGHMYFIEDGVEEGNIFDHNLGIMPNIHYSLLVSDLQPAVFWVTNPNNHFYNNSAVNGKNGWWYAMPILPTGTSAAILHIQGNSTNPGNATASMLDRNLPLGDFIGNTAHSNVNGLFIDKGQVDNLGNIADSDPYNPKNFSAALKFVSTTTIAYSNSPSGYGQSVPAVIRNFTSYKNTQFGIWGRGSFIMVVGARLSDNFVGCQFPGNPNMLLDSVIVGDSDNIGNPIAKLGENGRSRPNKAIPDEAIVGYRSYDSGGGDMIYNTRFYNLVNVTFTKNGTKAIVAGKVRNAGALGASSGSNVLNPINRYYFSTFYNTPNHIYLYPDQNTTGTVDGTSSSNIRSYALPDVDGSVTGNCGAWWVGPSAHVHYPQGCVKRPEWGLGWFCPPGGQGIRSFTVGDATQAMTFPSINASKNNLVLTRLNDNVSIAIAPKIDNMQPDLNYYSWENNLIVNQDWLIVPGANTSWLSYASISLKCRKGEWVNFAIPYPPGTTFKISSSKTNYQLVSAKNQLQINTYFYDTVTNLLWIKVLAPSEDFINSYFGIFIPMNFMTVTISATCPNKNCGQRINKILPFSPPPTGPIYSNCEKNSGVYSGNFSYSPIGTVSSVFKNSLQNNWTIKDSSCNVSNNLVSCLLYTTSVSFERNQKLTINPNNYTHFELLFQASPGFPITFLILQFYGSNASVYLHNPSYTNNVLIGSGEVVPIKIPISDLGLSSIANARGFSISRDESPPMQFTLNNIQFASYSVSTYPLASYPPEPVVPAPINSYYYTGIR